MNSERAGLLVAEQALATGRRLDECLNQLPDILRTSATTAAASLAQAGQLPEALRRLRVSPHLADAAGAWPRVVSAARGVLEQLPDARELRRPLRVLGAYSLAVYGFQLAAILVLQGKIVPAIETFGGEVAKGASGQGLGVVLYAMFPLVVVAWLVALGWTAGLGGRWSWKHQVDLALRAQIGAALIETGAPHDVVSDWLRRDGRLQVASEALQLSGGHQPRETSESAPSPREALAADLRAVASGGCAQVRATAARFHAVFRTLAVSLLVVQGGLVFAYVIGLIARAPLGVPLEGG